jgi:hypothetical protein
MNKLLVPTVGLALLILFPVVSYGQAESREVDALIVNTIRHLGERDVKQDFEVFSRHPARSAELLINQLRPARRGKYRNHPKVVRQIRALRFLTGLDFKARTIQPLTDDEKQFLEQDDVGRVKFFGTWMSRDVVFVGPRDAQRRIIKQWKDWFMKNGKTHKYSNDTSLDDWYF